MPVFVTGGAGFIGSAVVRQLLAEGRKLRCAIEPGTSAAALRDLEVELVEVDIRDRRGLAECMRGCQVMYHLAAIYRLWMRDPSLIYEVNVGGTANLLDLAMELGYERVIHTSSIASVGRPPTGTVSDESTAFNQWQMADHYIRSKWLSEGIALRMASRGLPLVVVNPAFPFGAGDMTPTPTGQVIVDILRRRLPGYGPGGINLIDVEDAAAGHLSAERRGRIGERYILGNYNISHRDFYRLVCERAGISALGIPFHRGTLVFAGRMLEGIARVSAYQPTFTAKVARYASRELYFDSTKAHTQLALPRTPIEVTVDRAISWFRDHNMV